MNLRCFYRRPDGGLGLMTIMLLAWLMSTVAVAAAGIIIDRMAGR